MALPLPSSDEGLIKQLLPALMLFLTIAAAAGQIHFCVMARILERDHLKLGTSRLQGHQKKHALGVERGVNISAFTSGGNAVKHAEGGVIEITLGSHRSQNRRFLNGTVLPAHHNHPQEQSPPDPVLGLETSRSNMTRPKMFGLENALGMTRQQGVRGVIMRIKEDLRRAIAAESA